MENDAPVQVGEIPVYVDVAGPHGADGYRPVKTMRLCRNVANGIFRLDEGKWCLTERGRKSRFLALTKPRLQVNGERVYLSDRCREIAEAAAKREAERRADGEHERAVKRARKLGLPVPKKPSAEKVAEKAKQAIEAARTAKEPNQPAPDAPPDPDDPEVDED